MATINASWSNGSPFTGKLSFAPSYSNDGGRFALAGNNIIIDPAGPGIGADGGTIQNITVQAVQ